MKKNFLLIITLFISFISTIPTIAQTACSIENNGNCETCFKIEKLYQNENNLYLKEILTKTLKASIHPDKESDIENTQYVCSVPYDESIIYNLHIAGLDSSWPRYRVENGKLLADMSLKTGKGV